MGYSRKAQRKGYSYVCPQCGQMLWEVVRMRKPVARRMNCYGCKAVNVLVRPTTNW
jgi:predicted SprT family Zn-dependent metalloprotease